MIKAAEMIGAAAARFPGRAAYEADGVSITYKELWGRAQAEAERLARGGDAPVVIYGAKSPEMIISMLACLIAGRAYVPIDVSVPALRIGSIIELLGAFTLSAHEPFPLAELSPGEATELPEETAYVMFTSGSTGEPKGVPVSAENLAAFIEWITAFKPLSEYDGVRVLNQANFNFDLSVADIYYSLCSGHTLTACTGGLRELLELARKANVTVTTPSFMKYCLLDPEFCGASCPELRCMYFCGETLEVQTAAKIFDRFPEIRIINAYGPTEATSAVTAAEITRDMLSGDSLPIGETANPTADITVEDGEIVLRGRSVFGGYLNVKSNRCFCENGVNGYRTGDLGSVRSGRLYFGGRTDGQIKYKGYRIELADIERNISALEGVDGCVAVAKYDGCGRVKLIKAFASGDASPEAIAARLTERLPEYMIPKQIAVLDSLPLNQNGKIDRRALAEL